eukprot:1149422-Pelagomonas_calceolata.AAC.14
MGAGLGRQCRSLLHFAVQVGKGQAHYTTTYAAGGASTQFALIGQESFSTLPYRDRLMSARQQSSCTKTCLQQAWVTGAQQSALFAININEGRSMTGGGVH